MSIALVLNQQQCDNVVWAGRQHMMDECVSLGPCVQALRTTGKWRRICSLNSCVLLQGRLCFGVFLCVCVSGLFKWLAWVCMTLASLVSDLRACLCLCTGGILFTPCLIVAPIAAPRRNQLHLWHLADALIQIDLQG